jgi:hypothetical protein
MLFINPAIWLSGCRRGLPANDFKSLRARQITRSSSPRGNGLWVLARRATRRVGLLFPSLVIPHPNGLAERGELAGFADEIRDF